MTLTSLVETDQTQHCPVEIGDVEKLRGEIWRFGYRPVALRSDEQPEQQEWLAGALENPPEAAVAVPDPDSLGTGVLCNRLRVVQLCISDPETENEIEDIAIDIFGATRHRRVIDEQSLILV